MLGVRSETGSTPYQIAVNKGLANQQTALLRAEAPGSENFTDFSNLLIHYLSDLSYDYACANWLSGIEFIIWQIVFTDDPYSDEVFRWELIDEETKEDLRFLSRKAEGWAAWSNDEGDPAFVPLERWEKIWNERNFE